MRIQDQNGLTLIELLVVVLIVAILAAIAVPMYTGYMQRARRADAKTALEHVRAAQEMWRAEKGGYSLSQAELQTTMKAPETNIGSHYTWAFTATGLNAWTAQATALGGQATDGNLTINQDGVKNPPEKWAR